MTQISGSQTLLHTEIIYEALKKNRIVELCNSNWSGMCLSITILKAY